jgi:Fur family ferric uptake transcriptional regulator
MATAHAMTAVPARKASGAHLRDWGEELAGLDLITWEIRYDVGMPTQATPASSGSLDSIRIVEPMCAVFRRTLKKEGLKYTPERARILESVLQIEGVFEAERVLKELREAGFKVSKATVYRTIKLLQDAGIIQRVPLEREQAVYQVAFGGGSPDLLVRVDTNEVVPIEVPELTAICAQVCRRLSLTPQSHRLMIFATAAKGR